MMVNWLREAWILLGLALVQMVLTFTFTALVPYGYLTYVSRNNEVIADQIDELVAFAEKNNDRTMSGTEIFDEVGPTIRELVEAVPWVWFVVVGSVLIYPFLGVWATRLLTHPQAAGVLILGSVLTQQNIVMVPRNIDYWNIARVDLSLLTVLIVIGFQFFLLAGGILYQHGQNLLKERQDDL